MQLFRRLILRTEHVFPTRERRRRITLHKQEKSFKNVYNHIRALACFFLLGASISTGAEQLRTPFLRETYLQFKNIELADGVYAIRDSLRIVLRDYTVLLTRGTLQFLRGHDGKTGGFVFDGEGSAVFTPRHEIERQQLARFTKMKRFQGTFDYFVLRSESPEWQPRRLAGSLRPAFEKNLEDAQSYARNSESALLKETGYNLSARLLVESVFDSSSFTACIFRNLNEGRAFAPTYFYFYDPRVYEQVQFFQYRPKALGVAVKTLCSYPLDDYLAPRPVSSLRITKFNGWIQLERDGSLDAHLGADIYTATSSPRSLYFQLSDKAKIRAITNEDGDSLDFVQENYEKGVSVFCAPGMASKDTLRLTFSYRGDLLERSNAGNWHLRDKIFWHPRLGYLRRAKYKLVFKYPKDLDLIATGEWRKEWDEQNWRMTYCVEETPSKASMFALGKFRRRLYWGPDSTRIDVYAARRQSWDLMRQITDDFANSIYFLTSTLAPFPYDLLKVVESPTLDSQGFPGFINLTWLSFDKKYESFLNVLRSHEVAHQWWGNRLGWRSYRDQWLSEGFAEYMGALYIAWAAPGSNSFQELLQAWQDDILNRGSFGVSLGMRRFGFSKEALRKSNIDEAGPIYLGKRLGQNEASDYYLLVYEKSAYILHMLRNYFIDDDTGSDHKFWALLRDFMNSYAGKDPATIDFINLVSEHAGQDMRWFFEQWLLNTQIPEYEYTYSVREREDGYYLTGSIKQKNVSETFRAAIPVLLHFADKTTRRERLIVDRPEMEFLLGPFLRMPVNFEFNAGRAVLAKVKGGQVRS